VERLAIVIPYTKENRISYNVLIAALDRKHMGIPIYLMKGGIREILDNVRRLSEKYRKVIVALSLMTTQLVRILDDIMLLNRVKSKLNNIISVAGGPHPSGDPCGTLELGFDFVFIGEAERSFVEFIARAIEGDDVFKVKGIAYKENDSYFMTKRPEPIDLNDYPPFPVRRSMYNPIEITRGCPFACRYCQVSYIHGVRPRHRTVANILEYCKLMLKRGRKDIRFISPNSFGYGSTNGKSINHDAIAELIERLYSITEREGGRIFFGTFPSEIRPDFVDEDVLKILKGRVANKRVIIGAQSGSDKMLKIIGRGHTKEDILNAVRLVHKYGFKADVDFIFGLPEENEEDIIQTEELIIKITNMGARIHAHTFIPLPGTPFANARPGKVPDRIKRLIYRLTGYGLAYGYWERQERLAEEIYRLRKIGVIRTDIRPKVV